MALLEEIVGLGLPRFEFANPDFGLAETFGQIFFVVRTSISPDQFSVFQENQVRAVFQLQFNGGFFHQAVQMNERRAS